MNNHADDRAAQQQNSAEVFARLHEQDIEQFYAHYQLWGLRRRVPLLEQQIETLREHLDENQRTLETLRPSALALAVLVRLQSSGVNDTDVLDLMLDRGEDWLDRMMQRLDYCEQVEDFIQGDYTQWCVKSLDGAYDWIDSLLGSITENRSYPERGGSENSPTEALLLQKLSQEDEEVSPETTPRLPALEPEDENAEVPASLSEIDLSSQEMQDAGVDEYVESGISELVVSAESEQPKEQELPGWKDLEDLEAPESHPAPWYSVNLTADGSSIADSGTEQTGGVDDWITALQADYASRQTASSGAPMIPEAPAALAEADGSPAPESVSFSAENENISSIESISTPAEPASSEEGLGEESDVMEAEETVESATSEEVLSETDDDAETLSEINVEEDADQEGAVETPASSADAEKHIIEINETTSVEILENDDQADEIVSEVAGEQEEEPAGQAQLEVVSAAADEQTHDIAAVEANSEQINAESDEVAPGIGDLQVDERIEEESLEAPGAAENEQLELVAHENVAGASELAEEQIEASAWEASETAISAGTGEAGRETAEAPASHQEEQKEREAWDNEVESAAVLNDVLSLEEEQEEQKPWYEYLEMGEPAHEEVRAESKESSPSQEIGSAAPTGEATTALASNALAGKATEESAGEVGTSEIYEYVVEAENTGEQTEIVVQESVPVGENDEIEGWQTWQSQEADDETLPLALKDMQIKQQSLAGAADADVTAELSAPAEIDQDLSETDSAVRGSETDDATSGLTPVEEEATASVMHEEADTTRETEEAVIVSEEVSVVRMETVEEVSGVEEVAVAHAEVEIPWQEQMNLISEESTVILPIQGARVQEEIIVAAVESVAGAEAVPQRAVAAPPAKKPGFWRRLFSFGRKKKAT